MSSTDMLACFGEGYIKSDISLDSDEYPKQLALCPDPPETLYVMGNTESLNRCLAIVGARGATPYGEACASRFAAIAASMGISVVSGGAIGCDLSAHKGALNAGGVTVAVLGSGADIAYPRRGKSVFEKALEEGGAIVSEMPWGAQPRRWAFSKRNRIIAGLSRAVLIVEAGLPSGTFSTADFALEAGREVMVVPGSIFSAKSTGSNRLIRDGAVPIIDDASFIDEMLTLFDDLPLSLDLADDDKASANRDKRKKQRHKTSKSSSKQNADSSQLDMTFATIQDYIAANPMTPDALSESLGMGVVDVIKVLSSLETWGLVCRYPDGRFGIDPRDRR